MARRFMVGTVDDKPLLIVTLDGLTYFVDLDTMAVFADKPGLPLVADSTIVDRVLNASKDL